MKTPCIAKGPNCRGTTDHWSEKCTECRKIRCKCGVVVSKQNGDTLCTQCRNTARKNQGIQWQVRGVVTAACG
jgi:hypothetical protein